MNTFWQYRAMPTCSEAMLRALDILYKINFVDAAEAWAGLYRVMLIAQLYGYVITITGTNVIIHDGEDGIVVLSMKQRSEQDVIDEIRSIIADPKRVLLEMA